MATERIVGIDFGTSTPVIQVNRYCDGKPVEDKITANIRAVQYSSEIYFQIGLL